MVLPRRAVLAGAAGALAGALGTRLAAARAPVGPELMSCGLDADGRYCVAGFDRAGRLRFKRALPGRGHAAALRPSSAHSVVLARRPGTFAVVLDSASGRVLQLIEAAAGRHFCGHGAFSADGRVLFAGENDYGAGRGVLGLYDATAGYRRLGEVPSHGTGPHELRLMPDGRTLVIANGGIRTHPDLGRAKLNLAEMAPNLAYLEAATGRLLRAVRLPQHLHKLSIRHLDVSPKGQVALAMQYEGDRRDEVPLVGLHAGAGDIRLLRAPGEIRPLRAPGAVERRLRHYTGSVAFDASGTLLAASSPRGGLVAFWDATGPAYLGHIEAPDASGLAATGTPNEILVTAGDGALRLVDAAAAPVILAQARTPGMKWDNHLLSGRRRR